MSVSIKYLEIIKNKYNIESKNALGLKLGINRQRINGYYNQGKRIDTYVAVKIAEKLGIDPMKIIIELSEEKAKNPEEKKFWKDKYAKIALASIIMIMPLTALASDLINNLNITQSIHYTQLIIPLYM